MRGGDGTIVVLRAFHAAEIRIANAERAALVLPVGAAKCTALDGGVDICNVGVVRVAAIASEDVVRRALRTSREKKTRSGDDEVIASVHAIALSRTRARATMQR